MHKRFEKNVTGSDYVVGDIHGCFSKLAVHLQEIGFDESRDRLFSVGDLVDRGPESELAYEWLARPWFHAVRGNHEQMAIDCADGFADRDCYIANGGAWFLCLTKEEQRLIADAFSVLPIAITVATECGDIGIVHADCPAAAWGELVEAFDGDRADIYAQYCMWSRERFNSGDRSGVAGVNDVYVGHTPLKSPVDLGNVHFIDTGAVFGGRINVVKLS